MDRTTFKDFFEEVETTEEYNGYLSCQNGVGSGNDALVIGCSVNSPLAY